MAGIGFELRKLMKGETYTSILKTYAYAGMISSGPWIFSIVIALVIGIISIPFVIPQRLVTEFQTVVTYLICFSLICTGFAQLGFTRYSADRIFEKEHRRLVPNFNGLLLLVMSISGVIAYPLTLWVFPEQTMLFRILAAASFVTLCGVWIAAILLSGLKAYKAILYNFMAGYTVTLLLVLILRNWNLEGLMVAFLAGQSLLLTGMFLAIFRGYPSPHFIQFDFLKSGRMYQSLILTGFFYNLGIWADKLVNWFHPWTGTPIIGQLRAAYAYDLPVFIAYLAIIPGMAVFLVRMETDFVEYYDRFYDAVREGGGLSYIQETKDEMVRVAREGIYDIMKIQGIATIIVVVAGPKLLDLVGIPRIHVPLLNVQVVAAGFQVVLLAILNVYFYLDRRRRALLLTFMFALLNGLLTYLSIQLGPYLYGYGFAGSLLITIVVGLTLLDRDLERLEYETFMLR